VCILSPVVKATCAVVVPAVLPKFVYVPLPPAEIRYEYIPSCVKSGENICKRVPISASKYKPRFKFPDPSAVIKLILPGTTVEVTGNLVDTADAIIDDVL
jgi:hypothetical protein